MNKHVFSAFIAVFALFLTACERRGGTQQCLHLSGSEWRRSDVLTIPVDTLRRTGTYYLDGAVRVRKQFPLMGFTMVATLTLHRPDTTYQDTIRVAVADSLGQLPDNGRVWHTVAFRGSGFPLDSAQYGCLQLRHIMTREVLPCLNDFYIDLHP